MNLALYQVADLYLLQLQAINDVDLAPDDLAAVLDNLSGELEVKATNVAMFARNLEATAAQIKEAEEQMAARRKALEKRSAALREYLLSNMQRTGIKKIESPFFTITVKANPESLVVEPDAVIPPEYYRDPPPPPPPEKALDKAALKDDLKQGVLVEGCRLERKYRVEIK